MNGKQRSDETPWVPALAVRSSGLIAAQIRDNFFAGMRPGDWIGTETELAASFGVSRTTMRDAIRSLEAQGIVVVAVGAKGGVRVARSDPSRIADAIAAQLHLMDVTWSELVDAMRAVEPVIAVTAAARATTPDIDRLRSLVDQSTGVTNFPAQFTDAALDFHLALAEIAGNRVLLATVRALRGAQRLLFTSETSTVVAARVSLAHTRITDAIAAGDGETAAAVMAEHLQLVAKGKPTSQS